MLIYFATIRPFFFGINYEHFTTRFWFFIMQKAVFSSVTVSSKSLIEILLTKVDRIKNLRTSNEPLKHFWLNFVIQRYNQMLCSIAFLAISMCFISMPLVGLTYLDLSTL